MGYLTCAKEAKIFVQIPSYRDSQLIATIKSLLGNSYNPSRLVVWVCWQHSTQEKLPKNILRIQNLNIINIDFHKSKGAGWARSILQKKWNNEPYSLLVDSHSRFSKNWDKKLINMISQLKKNGVPKPLISTLPPSFFDPYVYPAARVNYPTKIYPIGYSFGLLNRFQGRLIPLYHWLEQPIPAQFIAMGFLFSEGYFNNEIHFDPNIYFFGDDITTGLRAYCHGYDFFHPHKILVWHLYNRDTRVPHWNDHREWREMDKISYKRVRQVLQGAEFDRFRIGTFRSIADYEAYIDRKLVVCE